MGERTPRRNNNIVLSAQQLDHNASMARDLNKRASNRLRLHKGNIDGHQTANLNSLNYEMKRLRHELREITHNSGTLDIKRETTQQQTMTSNTGIDATRRSTRKSKRMASGRNARTGVDSFLSRSIVVDGNTETQAQQDSFTARRKSVSLPTLPSMSSTSVLSSPRDPPSFTSLTSIPKVENSVEDSFSSPISSKPTKQMRRKQSRRKVSVDDGTPALSNQTKERKISVSITDANGETKLRREDSSFANLNLDAVKGRIHHRLSQAGTPDQSFDDDDIDPDISPYMHVPPDGLPRTVYLLPPLTDLLQEAKKARYIRRPKKPLQEVDMDDPERELGIDEIFSKKR